MNINRFNGLNAKLLHDSLRLNEIGENSPVAELTHATIPQGEWQDARSSFVPFRQYAG